MQLPQKKKTFIWLDTKKVKQVNETVFSEMNFFDFLSLTFHFDIKFQYIKMCIPSKISRGGGWGMWQGLGMDKIMGFYISPYLMFSIMFASVRHFHNHLYISISPIIIKEIFAKGSLPPTCHVSCVTCQLTYFMCHVSHVMCRPLFFFTKG